MDTDQLCHYSNKLAYEIDSWDLKVALENGENVIVIDSRSPQAFAAEHIPGAISLHLPRFGNSNHRRRLLAQRKGDL